MRLSRVLLIAVLTGLLLSACGGAANTPVSPTPTGRGQTAQPSATAPQATATPRPTSTPAPTATAALTSSGELTVAIATLGASNLYPGLPPSQDWFDAMFDMHLGSSPDSQLEGKYGLVTSWTANGNSTVWTLKLRDNVRFHNGERATSRDITFAMSLGLDPKTTFSRGGDLRRSLSKTETPDDNTLVVTLTGTDIFWFFTQLSKLGDPGFFPQHVISSKYATSVGAEGYNKTPLGSGPYKFKSITIGDRVVVEAAEVPHFIYGIPRTKVLTYLAVPEENTKVALLQSGAVDLAAIQLSSEKALAQAGLNMIPVKGAGSAIFWNGQYPAVIPGKGPNPFANVNVRKAVFWYGIDRQALVDGFFQGRGVPSMDYPISDTEIYAFDKPLPVAAYDPAKAKAMIAAEGFGSGFEIDAYINTAASAFPEIMEAIAVFWERLGLKVNRKPFTGGGFTNVLVQVYNKNGFSTPTVSGLIGGGIGGTKFPSIQSSAALLQDNPQAVYSIGRDPEQAKLAQAWVNSATVEEYKKNGAAFRQYAYEHMSTYVKLYNVDSLWAASKKVSPTWKAGGRSTRYQEAAALR